MKQFFLATVLIAVPVILFSAYEHYLAPQAEASQSQKDQSRGLGDLKDFKAIIKDVQKIAATGDFKATEKRATDFESEWDAKQKSLRPLDPVAWGTIDSSADALFNSLRNGAPAADIVNNAVANLQAALGNSDAANSKTGSQSFIDGIAVTDLAGHPVPCEDLIGKLKDASAKPDISAGNMAKATDFLSKALERCNADDDQHADTFSAQGIALLSK